MYMYAKCLKLRVDKSLNVFQCFFFLYWLLKMAYLELNLGVSLPSTQHILGQAPVTPCDSIGYVCIENGWVDGCLEINEYENRNQYIMYSTETKLAIIFLAATCII